MICGGIVIGMGFLTHWSQLVALRVILGALDSGFFPSCVYLLSTWYTRCKFFLDLEFQNLSLY